MSDFCLVVTSRGRPDNAIRLLAAIEATATGDLTVQLVLDADDPTAPEYGARLEGRMFRPGLDVTAFVGERKGHIGSLNEWCMKAASRYSIVGQMGDDHLPRTKGWDQRIRHALATPGIAYGNDLFQSENLPTAVFMSAEVINAIGKFAPEGLWHLYADNYWRDLGLGAGCLRYLPDVIIEHLHPMAQKSAWDETYEDSNASEVDLADRACWEAYQRERLPDDIGKVKAAL